MHTFAAEDTTGEVGVRTMTGVSRCSSSPGCMHMRARNNTALAATWDEFINRVGQAVICL